MNSRTRVVGTSPRNQGTRVLGAARGVDRAGPAADGRWMVEELRERWQEILERVHLWRAEHPEGAALAVVVRDGARFDVVLHQIAGEPVAVIVGRHSECDVVIEDQHASLRHAAVMGWPTASDTQPGRARAVAIDLRSELGLRTRDGRVARRVTTSTALSFRAGAAEVTALVADEDAPFAVRWADQLEAQLSGALVDEIVPRTDVSAWEHSVVVRTRVAGMPTPAVAEDQLAIRATRAAIERGVVLGRYARCERTTALAGDENVSRVHALVFAADCAGVSALWVVDTASSGGTSLVGPDGAIDVGEGRRIARLPANARLYLAGTEAVLVVDP